MIYRLSEKYKNAGLLIIRAGLGLSFIYVHGFKKIAGGPERWTEIGYNMKNLGIEFLPVFWGFMAAFAETIGGLLILLGLLFRPAAALIIITMFVAASSHVFRDDPFSKVAYPLEMLVVFLGLFLIGPGRHSLDELWLNRKK